LVTTAAASIAAMLALGAGAVSDEAPASAPDGWLVLGVVAGRDGSGAVTRELAVVADARNGRQWSHPLQGGTLCHAPLLVGGDGVVFSGYQGGRAVALTLPLDLGRRPRSLGGADVLARIGSSGRLLIGRARFNGRRTVLGPLREVSASARTRVRSRVVLPPWSRVEAGVDDGLLVSHERRLTVWDRAAGRPRLSLRRASLLAAGERRFAWCRTGCSVVRVWDPDHALSVPAPPGVSPISWIRGALSPDDRRLAVAVGTSNGVRAAVADLLTGSWTVISGGRVGGYQAMAWSPSGEWLVFTADRRHLMAWQLGAGRAVPLPTRPGGTVMSIATAPP
jgi:hypothetical protein